MLWLLFATSRLGSNNLMIDLLFPPAAEMLVDLPLAYFLPPNATTPGQLPMTLDFEQTRWVPCVGG